MIVYIHMFRGLYYGSYKQPRELLWILGVVILLLMIATAFMGYVLPWGQMSYWAATVITNLFSAIPLVGQKHRHVAVGRLHGRQPDLNRFFSLHYLLPFVIVAVVLLHLMALHRYGSNNPLGIDHQGAAGHDPVPSRITRSRTCSGCACSCWSLRSSCSTRRTSLGSSDNYIPANPMETPNHIVPEWYLLPYYAILRSITFDSSASRQAARRHPDVRLDFPAVPRALARHLAGAQRPVPADLQMGVLAPGDRRASRSARSAPTRRQGMVVTVGQIATFYYFFHFLILMPLIGKLERPRPLPISIGAAVLERRRAARPRRRAAGETLRC